MPLFIIVALIKLFTILHPVHISLTQMDYNEKNKSIELTHKIYVDDFELALKQYDDLEFRLGTEKEMANSDQFIQKYIDATMKIYLDGEEKQANFIGREVDFEAIWIFREIKDVNNIGDLVIENSILTDLYDDQKNILHLKYLEEKKSFLFKKGNTREEANF
ncbi:DUF6702 family protein [Flexithrix dorotheae]|uniref:DUF6702 family protein n=1 Tax=Flexithrix dorotheae TaxID=70993 RepID=UPI00037AAC62|nr:DUF6702 family protein [Flexithrix dorotheae]